MKQTNKSIATMDRNQLNRFVTANFLEKLEEIVAGRLIPEITNESQFAKFLDVEQAAISKLKSHDHRYVTLDVIAKAVNRLGLNANALFAENHKNEKLIRDLKVNEQDNSGATNNVGTMNGVLISGGVLEKNAVSQKFHLEKIIQKLPKKDRAEIKQALSNQGSQLTEMTEKLIALKKIIDNHEKAIATKDKTLAEMQGKYIALLEKGLTRKK